MFRSTHTLAFSVRTLALRVLVLNGGANKPVLLSDDLILSILDFFSMCSRDNSYFYFFVVEWWNVEIAVETIIM